MKSFLSLALVSILSATSVRASPISAKLDERSELIAIPGSSNTGAPASTDPNESYTQKFLDTKPQPIRGTKGAPLLGPYNNDAARQNADLLAPPSTDQGFVPAAKWPFSLSHNRLSAGGWARQQNKDVLPSATEMAGVNMRLKAGAIREMHWHTAAEWAYMLEGSGIAGAVNDNGENWLAEVNAGDLWYFPAGTPHFIQASNVTDGCEFLLVFDSGDFNEDSTFMLTDWFAHTPKAILDKDFSLSVNSTAFDDIPGSDLWIFQAPLPASVKAQDVVSPAGAMKEGLTYEFSKQKAVEYEGGSVKIQDSNNFPASKTISAALVKMNPGSLRELHWHPDSDEWEYYISGEYRTGIFAGSHRANTFDFQAGDVGYIKQNHGHWIECISKEPCEFLEVVKSPTFRDISLSQWLSVSPVQVVADHLRISNDTIKSFKNQKTVVLKGDLNWA